MLADSTEALRQIRGHSLAHSGHAFLADIVKKSRGMSGDESDAAVGGCRGNDINCLETRFDKGGFQLRGLLRWKIEGEYAIHTGFNGEACKDVQSVREKKIVICVEDNGGIGKGPHGPHQRKELFLRHAGGKSALRSQLIGQAIRQRIREGHANLENVSAVFKERPTDREGVLGIGIAAADIGHKQGPVLFSGPGKCIFDSIH